MIESCDIGQKASESTRGENGNLDKSEAELSADLRNHCQNSNIQKDESVNTEKAKEKSRVEDNQTPPCTSIIEKTSKSCTVDLPNDISQNSNRNSVELKVN